MSICHHLWARKVEFFIFWKQTAVLDFESDCGLLPNKQKFQLSWPIQMMANAHFVRRLREASNFVCNEEMKYVI